MKLRNMLIGIVATCASICGFAQAGFNAGAYFLNPTTLNNVPMCTQFINGLCVYTPTLLYDLGNAGGLQYNGDQISGGLGGSFVKVIYGGVGTGLPNTQRANPITPINQWTIGAIYEWKPASQNTNSTPTISFGFGPILMKKCGGNPLVAGDTLSNVTSQGMYDGTYMQLMNPQNVPCGVGVTNFTSLSSSSNCVANGSAANPSLVSCGASPTGSFSCATASSTGTCVVSSTVVTTNSQILLTPTASKGTLLSVTCNTAPTLPPSILISAQAVGSFTVNMPTFTTNPVCYDYLVIN